MPRRVRKPAAPKIDTVTFRPDSRDGSKDFEIPAEVARSLFEDGTIWGDATNGGMMPNPSSRYNVRQHLVPRERSNNQNTSWGRSYG